MATKRKQKTMIKIRTIRILVPASNMQYNLNDLFGSSWIVWHFTDCVAVHGLFCSSRLGNEIYLERVYLDYY